MRFVACVSLVLLLTIGIFPQRSSRDKVLVSNEKYVITYRSTPKEVIFTMDDLRARDTGAATGYEMPISYFGLYLDTNLNRKVDARVDVAYGLRKNMLALCSQYFLSEYSYTACGNLLSDAYYEKSARRTEQSLYVHIVHRYTIPRSEISKRGQRKIHVVFQCLSGDEKFGAPGSYYPKLGSHLFDSSLIIAI
jgi:hypothetical protein